MRATVLLAPLCAFPGCMTAPDAVVIQPDGPAPTDATFLACTDDGVDFNLRDITPTALSLEFIDIKFDMTFEEVTTAAMSSGPVSLTSYVNAQSGVRVTLARDGSPVPRARVQIPPDTEYAGPCASVPEPLS